MTELKEWEKVRRIVIFQDRNLQTYHVVVVPSSFASRNSESVRVSSSSRPKHGEGSEVRNRESFSNVNSSDRTGTLDDDVGTLTGIPTRE